MVRPEKGEWESFLVTDCAGDDETIEWMQSKNVLLEVDHETAVRWGTVGRGVRVQVIKRVRERSQ